MHSGLACIISPKWMLSINLYMLDIKIDQNEEGKMHLRVGHNLEFPRRERCCWVTFTGLDLTSLMSMREQTPSLSIPAPSWTKPKQNLCRQVKFIRHYQNSNHLLIFGRHLHLDTMSWLFVPSKALSLLLAEQLKVHKLMSKSTRRQFWRQQK